MRQVHCCETTTSHLQIAPRTVLPQRMSLSVCAVPPLCAPHPPAPVSRVVLSDSGPLSLAQVRSPTLPILLPFRVFLQSFRLRCVCFDCNKGLGAFEGAASDRGHLSCTHSCKDDGPGEHRKTIKYVRLLHKRHTSHCIQNAYKLKFTM